MNFFQFIASNSALFSIFILGFGVLIFVFKTHAKVHLEFGVYLLVLFLIELFSKPFGSLFANNNLLLLSISAFIHFVFLTWIYSKNFFHTTLKITFLLLIVGLLPLFLTHWNTMTTVHFQSYDRAIYDLALSFYSLFTFYQAVQKGYWNRSLLVVNAAVLLYFSFDFFLAIGSNYLVHEKLILVSWFWFLRALFLQVFYSTLIYYIWKVGKTPQPRSFG